MQVPQLSAEPRSPFPPPSEALVNPDGLLAFGGDLHPERLFNAYRSGIFPWFEPGDPILWWSPSTRSVAAPIDIHTSRSTLKYARKHGYRVSFNRCVSDVIVACATANERTGATWITRPMLDAYVALAEQGWVQSVEVWYDSTLVGGLYGVTIHPWFFGESMFSDHPNASKFAMYALSHALQYAHYEMIDAQMPTDHLQSLGFRDLPRANFLAQLATTTWAESPVGLSEAALDGI